MFDPSKARGPRRGPDVGQDPNGADVTADFAPGAAPGGGAAQTGEGAGGAQVAAGAAGHQGGSGAGGAPMSVTELVGRIKHALAGAFPDRLHVVGQISGMKAHSSGHLYFRLKDAGAAIDAVMFRSAAARLKFRPTDGLEVVAEGRVDVH